MAKSSGRGASVSALTYRRISSRTNKDKSGFKRQKGSTEAYAKQNLLKVVGDLAEVVSGSIPVERRVGFKQLLEKAFATKVKKIVVENARAVARSMEANEELYKDSKRLGVEIIATDAPNLYKHAPNPTEKFCRRVVFAYTELEKDVLVERLSKGLAARVSRRKAEWRAAGRPRHQVDLARRPRGPPGRPRRYKSATSVATPLAEKYLTRHGAVKANGRDTILSNMHFTPSTARRVRAPCLAQRNHQISTRELARRLLSVLPWGTWRGRKKPLCAKKMGPGQAVRLAGHILQRWP